MKRLGRHYDADAEAIASLIFDPVADSVSEARIHDTASKFDELVLFERSDTGTFRPPPADNQREEM